jgi:thiosulfate/3-mercaptopyruvate sulfurtransferase
MTYAHPEFLISTETLAESLEEPTLRLYDCAVFLLPDPPRYRVESGQASYEKTHIPGAAFLDLTGDLSDQSSNFGFTLPPAAQLQDAFAAAGISDDSHVVLYSSGHLMWATRMWWMLHSAGHNNVQVLDGGFDKWQAENRPAESGAARYPAGELSINLDASRWAPTSEVQAAIQDGAVCTLNSLSPGVYSGESAMNYGRKGHITGSLNVHYEDLLSNGCFKSAAELEAQFEASDALNKPRVIAYCGGGISATIDALALSLIGHNNIAVYDGSMSQWVADPALPMTEGAQPA